MKRAIVCAAALCGMALLPACTATSSHSSASGGSATASASSDEAKSDAPIRSLWAQFFNAATSPVKRQSLLESGSSFKAVLAAQASQGAISATVTAVHFPDSSHAIVSFSLRVGSATHLPSVAGAAVLQGGQWLVSESTMCVVLAASGQHEEACS